MFNFSAMGVMNDFHCEYTWNDCSRCLVLEVESVQLCHTEVTVKIKSIKRNIIFT